MKRIKNISALLITISTIVVLLFSFGIKLNTNSSTIEPKGASAPANHIMLLINL